MDVMVVEDVYLAKGSKVGLKIHAKRPVPNPKGDEDQEIIQRELEADGELLGTLFFNYLPSDTVESMMKTIRSLRTERHKKR